jgi:exopolysaccharide biosynthesis polyprenyl glycosylphosphotransferase
MSSQLGARNDPQAAHSSAATELVITQPRPRLRAVEPDARRHYGASAQIDNRGDRILRRSLLVADVIAFSSSIVAVSMVSGRAVQVTWLGVFSLLALCVGSKVLGLYDRDEALLRKNTLDEAPKLFQVATLGALCTWLAGGFVIPGATLSRSEALLLWALLCVSLVLARAAARALALRVAPAERCFFVGDADAAGMIRNKFCDHHGVKAQLVAHLDPRDVAEWSTDTHSATRLSEISELARSLDVQRAIIASDRVDPDKMPDLICTLKAVGIKVSVLPRLLEVVGSSVEFDDLHGVTVMGIRRFAQTRSSSKVKRGFDLVATAIGLAAIAPLFVAISLAIRLDSRGPVFFRQRRVGRHGEHFEVLKFRTMVDGADAMKESLRDRNEAQDGLFKIAADPRVTRVGRVLRKTALDELPQLLNVLRGEMSLVGPRPLVLDEDERVTGWYRSRLELTPGMTGPWQILGPARVPLREMGAIDYLYVANWSLWGDFKILLRTVPHVLARRGL